MHAWGSAFELVTAQLAIELSLTGAPKARQVVVYRVRTVISESGRRG